MFSFQFLTPGCVKRIEFSVFFSRGKKVPRDSGDSLSPEVDCFVMFRSQEHAKD